MHDDLIRQVESNSGPRFTNVRVVNFSVLNGRRGVCSLVFYAWDNLHDRAVALKFIDPNHLSNGYMIHAFERESRLLKIVSRKDRCLTLIDDQEKFPWRVNLASGSADIPVGYFSMEWIDKEIDDRFLEQQRFDVVEKLQTFRLIVLAVQAIHDEGIFHRDLKADNIREKEIDGKRVLVVIDYGMAARVDEPPASISYPVQGGLGAPAYTAPESMLGLCFVRSVARGTDFWALGALLFELFNMGLLWDALRKTNYFMLLPAALNSVGASVGGDERLAKLDEFLDVHGAAFFAPSMIGRGSTVPPSISREIQDLFCCLCRFDYRSRCMDFDFIIKRIDICLKIVMNSDREKKVLELKRQRRENRIRKLEYRIFRQKQFISSGG